jgi:hypothetical protein
VTWGAVVGLGVGGLLVVAVICDFFLRRHGQDVERMSDEWDRAHRYQSGKRGYEQ